MKMFRTFGLMLIISSGSLVDAAEYIHSMRVNVPFAFSVQGERFAPGEYSVAENADGVILLQGKSKARMLLSVPLTPAKAGEVSGLRFGNTPAHDLEAVAVEGQGSRGVAVRVSRKVAFRAQ
jgi:hypothetical protein